MFKEIGQIASLMKNLPKIREEMGKLQERMGQIVADGDAGAGMVKTRVNGHLEVQSISLSEEALKMNDKEMLEDLIASAVNHALKKARQLVAEETSKMATGLGLPPERLQCTVDRFNQSVAPGTFDHSRLDECRTNGLTPEKTHWAQALDTPPFLGYPLRPGITFTYLGVKVNHRAEAIMKDGRPARNIFAAGEIMAGNILGKGYLAGIGMTIGTVFGRIAGTEAARAAK